MKIAIYPGSFNPFHKAHHNILLKAEKIFDEVFIARGLNPEKSGSTDNFPLPRILENRVILNYNGLLTDFIKTLDYDNITIIRGLRNSTDLQYEMTQYRYLQDQMPDIQLVSIFCDKEYEHISSTAIRLLTRYGDDKIQNYLI